MCSQVNDCIAKTYNMRNMPLASVCVCVCVSLCVFMRRWFFYIYYPCYTNNSSTLTQQPQYFYTILFAMAWTTHHFAYIHIDTTTLSLMGSFRVSQYISFTTSTDVMPNNIQCICNEYENKYRSFTTYQYDIAYCISYEKPTELNQWASNF